MAGVLDGVRILDLSWGIAGPMATMQLADHGADVVRIERPDGDPFRDQLGYRAWNRGKRSAVLLGHARSVHCLALGEGTAAGDAVLFTGSRDHSIKVGSTDPPH